MNEILKVENISKNFVLGKGFFSGAGKTICAVNNVSFSLAKGRCLGVAGESGSGKTTLAKVIMKLIKADSGGISVEGKNIGDIRREDYARLVQMVFQDPYSSLNPKMNIGDMLIEAIRVANWELDLNRKAYVEKAKFLLFTAGMSVNVLNDFPHQFSGGQKQRIAIARALALKPKILIADELLSALDVSIQSQILNLLAELKEKFEMSYVFITHDLGVLSALADDIAVMKDGEIVEYGDCSKTLANPSTLYTKNLVEAVPKI